jgi:hypothetical protein
LKAIAWPHVENGETSLFWHWNNHPLALSAPELFSFAKNKLISVRRAFNQTEFVDPSFAFIPTYICPNAKHRTPSRILAPY